MKVLVVVATAAEIAPTLAHFNLAENQLIETPSFDILITGVGMVATAFAMGKHVNSRYNVVINAGIAGAFDKTINLGDVLEVTEDIFAELGAEDNDNFIQIPDLGFGENTFHASEKPNFGLKKCKAITVNKVHGSEKSIATVQQIFNAQVESMEGAAVFYACHQTNMHVKQIRAISNYVEPRNRDNWQIGLAVKNLNQWLINFLNTKTISA